MDVAIGGCMREVPPCAPWGGLRDQLRALAQRQQSGPGDWEALVVSTGLGASALRGAGKKRLKSGLENPAPLAVHWPEGPARTRVSAKYRAV